jgi:hypothetical protein
MYGQLDMGDDLLEHTALIVFPIILVWAVSVIQEVCELAGNKPQ